MIEIDEEEYAKLMHDADDNESLRKIIRGVCITVLLIFSLFVVVKPILNHHYDKINQEESQTLAIEEAKTRVRVRKIESEGMTNEEYLRWLDILNK